MFVRLQDTKKDRAQRKGNARIKPFEDLEDFAGAAFFCFGCLVTNLFNRLQSDHVDG